VFERDSCQGTVAVTGLRRQQGAFRSGGDNRFPAASPYASMVGILGGVGGGLGLAGAFVTLWPGDARLEFGGAAVICGGLAAFALLSAAGAHRWLGAASIGLALVVFGLALALQGDYDLWVHAFKSAAGTVAKVDVLLASPALELLELSVAAIALASAIGLVGQYLSRAGTARGPQDAPAGLTVVRRSQLGGGSRRLGEM
jgi:hypothetical protein